MWKAISKGPIFVKKGPTSHGLGCCCGKEVKGLFLRIQNSLSFYSVLAITEIYGSLTLFVISQQNL